MSITSSAPLRSTSPVTSNWSWSVLLKMSTVQVEVFDTREKYARCARSWKRRPDVGTDADYPDLCARDAAVMRELA